MFGILFAFFVIVGFIAMILLIVIDTLEVEANVEEEKQEIAKIREEEREKRRYESEIKYYEELLKKGRR